MERSGKYELIRKLATGGMAEVFLARADGPLGFEKTVVLKRILPHLADNPQFVQMFLGEARLAAALNHQNISLVFDFGQDDSGYFIAMEHIDGPNLRSVIQRAQQLGQSLPIATCAKVISFACEGLAYAHEFADARTGRPLDLIHRDISPDNLMLTQAGGVKVVDFGIAKAVNQAHRTQTGVVKGKVAYMPPEQLQNQPLDGRTDIYALGIVLYELLTGQKPFDATGDLALMQAILFGDRIPARRRRPEVPQELERILTRTMARNPADRYLNCRVLQLDLERFLLSHGEPVGAFQIAELTRALNDSSLPLKATPHAAPAAQTGSLEGPITVPEGRASTTDSITLSGPVTAPIPLPSEEAPTTGEHPRPRARPAATSSGTGRRWAIGLGLTVLVSAALIYAGLSHEPAEPTREPIAPLVPITRPVTAPTATAAPAPDAPDQAPAVASHEEPEQPGKAKRKTKGGKGSTAAQYTPFPVQKAGGAPATGVDPKALADGARTAISEGRLQDALGLLNQCLALDPHAAQCHLRLGAYYARVSDLVRAERHYRLFLDYAPPGDPSIPKVRDILGMATRRE